jgi:hypothetical protein
MSASYIPYHPEQQKLLPIAIQDWLPQGHLAYFYRRQHQRNRGNGGIGLAAGLKHLGPELGAVLVPCHSQDGMAGRLRSCHPIAERQ